MNTKDVRKVLRLHYEYTAWLRKNNFDYDDFGEKGEIKFILGGANEKPDKARKELLELCEDEKDMVALINRYKWGGKKMGELRDKLIELCGDDDGWIENVSSFFTE